MVMAGGLVCPPRVEKGVEKRPFVGQPETDSERLQSLAFAHYTALLAAAVQQTEVHPAGLYLIARPVH